VGLCDHGTLLYGLVSKQVRAVPGSVAGVGRSAFASVRTARLSQRASAFRPGRRRFHGAVGGGRPLFPDTPAPLGLPTARLSGDDSSTEQRLDSRGESASLRPPKHAGLRPPKLRTRPRSPIPALVRSRGRRPARAPGPPGTGNRTPSDCPETGHRATVRKPDTGH
jgi:hypothetical protein